MKKNKKGLWDTCLHFTIGTLIYMSFLLHEDVFHWEIPKIFRHTNLPQFVISILVIFTLIIVGFVTSHFVIFLISKFNKLKTSLAIQEEKATEFLTKDIPKKDIFEYCQSYNNLNNSNAGYDLLFIKYHLFGSISLILALNSLFALFLIIFDYCFSELWLLTVLEIAFSVIFFKSSLKHYYNSYNNVYQTFILYHKIKHAND